MSSDLNLWAAVAAGDVDAARTLLRQPGVDVDAYDADGATLTYVAAAHGHTAMVEMLADEGGADISKATPDDAKALLVESWRLDPPPQEVQDVTTPVVEYVPASQSLFVVAPLSAGHLDPPGHSVHVALVAVPASS